MLASGEDGSFGGEGSGGGAGGGPEGGSGGDEARQRLAAAVARLLDGLAANLEAKARAYPRAEPALAALFLMNNAHYVAWAAEGGALEALLGRDWLERQRDAVEEWGARYHEATWAPVVALLQVRVRRRGQGVSAGGCRRRSSCLAAQTNPHKHQQPKQTHNHGDATTTTRPSRRPTSRASSSTSRTPSRGSTPRSTASARRRARGRCPTRRCAPPCAA